MNKTEKRDVILALVDDRKLLKQIQTNMQTCCDLQLVDTVAAVHVGLAQEPAVLLVEEALLRGETGAFLQHIQNLPLAPSVTLLVDIEQLNQAIQYLQEGKIFRFQTTPYDPQELDLAVHACVEQYRVLKHRSALESEISRQVKLRTDDLQKLYNYVSIINDKEDIHEICELAVKLTADILDSKRVSLLLPDKHNRLLEMVSATGIPEYVRHDVRIPIGHGIAGRVFSKCDSVIIAEQDDYEGHEDRYDSECFVSIPLISTSMMRGGKAVGVLNVTEPNAVDVYDQEALANLRAIAEATAIAIENKRQLVNSINSRDSVIMALARLSEYRNPDAGAHLQRLQVYCRQLCKQLQKKSEYSGTVDDEFIANIIHAAPLHDIGKAGIKENIVFRSSELSEEQKETLRSHTRIGGDTLKSLIEQGNTDGFLKMAVKIAYCHHERWNGSGYPKGLSEAEIPLPARIFALADVYDSLRTRGYKSKPLPHNKARSIILEGAGSLFDPEVVRAFLGCEEQLAKTANELAQVGVSGDGDFSDESAAGLDGEDAA